MLLGSNFKIPLYFLNSVKIVLEIQYITNVDLYYFKVFTFILYFYYQKHQRYEDISKIDFLSEKLHGFKEMYII
jgi:hypothetical protein